VLSSFAQRTNALILFVNYTATLWVGGNLCTSVRTARALCLLFTWGEGVFLWLLSDSPWEDLGDVFQCQEGGGVSLEVRRFFVELKWTKRSEIFTSSGKKKLELRGTDFLAGGEDSLCAIRLRFFHYGDGMVVFFMRSLLTCCCVLFGTYLRGEGGDAKRRWITLEKGGFYPFCGVDRRISRIGGEGCSNFVFCL